jgi:hypothetical protein
MQANTMTAPIAIESSNNTETSKLLTKILNTFYTSGIDRIKTYGKSPSGNIVGEFVADGTSFQYILNMKTNTVSYEVVGIKAVNKADSLLAEAENADRFKAIYSAREAFDISDASAIEQKLDSWFDRADAVAKVKVGAKAKANKSGKTLTCTPGKTFPCGAVCRAVGKPCKQPISPDVQEMATQVAAKIKTPTATSTATATKPTTTPPSTSTRSGKITAQQMAELIAAAKALEPDVGKKSTSLSKFLPKLINLKRIDPPTKEFDQDDLRAAAEALLEIGGFAEPPVLRRLGNPLDQRYEVVSGEFQVAAGIVARAMDPIRGENIAAMIIEEENEAAIAKQMKAQKNATKFNTRSAANISTAKPKKIANETPQEFEQRRSNGNTGKMMHLKLRKIDPGEPHSESDEAVAEAAKLIKAAGRNWIPVPVQQTKDYEYEVVGNSFIYEAAKKAGVDRLWTVIVDPLSENIKQAKLLSR